MPFWATVVERAGPSFFTFAIRCDDFEYTTLHDHRRFRVCTHVNQRRFRLMATAITAWMLCATFTLGYGYAAQPPTAKIVSVDYPRHALSGRTFSVTVVAEYSDKVGVDIGIWDVQTGVIQSISIPLRDTGRNNFTFKLTAPTTTIDWHLLAITRIWWQNAWYQDPLEGSQPFTIAIANTVAIVLTSSGAASTVNFDGTQYPLNNNSPLSLPVQPGVHHLEALSLIQGKVGERFVFAGWSDSINSSSRQIVVNDNVNIAALYRTEYYLSVKSDRGQVSGGGWYPAGSKPSFGIVPTLNALFWFGLVTENYRFAGWSGDSGSSATLESVTMNGPKSMVAKWVRSGISVDSFLIANAFLVGALILFIRGVYRHSRRRELRILHSGLQRWTGLFVVALILITILVPVPPTYAQLPAESRRSIVKIGDAVWYYWNNTASDTCLLWLGGGTTDERNIGYFTYDINPFQYESFGTIRFMQDLARYYCVIALQKGSHESYNPDSNRTIYQEQYQMDSRIIGDVHDWIKKQGYAHIFLVGYSTGAQVAAMEVALRAPEDWISPDGLVLITPRLSDVVYQTAYRIHASLLVLYGGRIETPTYISTGHDFYVNAQQDGWYGSHYLHKEFHVIEKMGHEVWTIYETGTYDTQAMRILVNFVDTVKSLQFTPNDVTLIAHGTENLPATPNAGLNLISAQAPYQILNSSIMRIETSFTYNVQASIATQVIAFNPQRGEIESAAEFIVIGNGNHVVYLDLVPYSNSSELSLEIIMLRKMNEGWQLATKPLFTNTRVMNSVSISVVSTIPSVPFVFDGTQLKTAENGVFRLETKPGVHVVQIESVTYPNSLTRVVFMGWDDGSIDTTRQLNIENDTILFANYRKQYFVNATSAYGQSAGSGWYDENSAVAISVDPPLVSGSELIFMRWTGDVSSNYSRDLLIVNSPKTVRAEWAIISNKGSVEPYTLVWLLASLVLFVVTLAWNLKPIRPMEDSKPNRT